MKNKIITAMLFLMFIVLSNKSYAKYALDHVETVPIERLKENLLEKYPVSTKVVHKPIHIEAHIKRLNKA